MGIPVLSLDHWFILEIIYAKFYQEFVQKAHQAQKAHKQLQLSWIMYYLL